MPKLIAFTRNPSVRDSGPKELQQVASVLLDLLLRKVKDLGPDERNRVFFQSALYGDSFHNNVYCYVVEDKELENVTTVSIMNACHFSGRWHEDKCAFVYHFDSPSSAKELEKKLLSRSFDLKNIKNITLVAPYRVPSTEDVNAAEVISAVPTAKAKISLDQFKDLSVRAVITTETATKWQSFFDRIQEMDEYGNELLSKGVSEKGILVRNLADDIRDEAIDLLKQGDPISERDLKDFQQTVHIKLTGKNTHDLLAEHRPGGASWKVVTGNVLLALTGIGAIALAIQLIYSKAKTGHYLLFGSPTKTTSEEKAEKVDEAINRLN